MNSKNRKNCKLYYGLSLAFVILNIPLIDFR